MKTSTKTYNSKELATLFTGRGLFSFFKDGKANPFYEVIQNSFNEREDVNLSYTALLKEIYQTAFDEYKNEYYYKNILATKLFLKRLHPEKACYLSEYPVARSIADVIIVDNYSSVFEIKTELDSPSRLKSQISDYKKVFEKIHVVTHLNQSNKYLRYLPSDVGLFAISQNGALKTIRGATQNTSYSFEELFRFLRMPEIENIILSIYGKLPEIRQVQKNRAYRFLLKYLPIQEFKRHWKVQVRKRGVSGVSESIKEGYIPLELAHWGLTKVSNEKELKTIKMTIHKPLSKEPKLCTFHF